MVKTRIPQKCLKMYFSCIYWQTASQKWPRWQKWGKMGDAAEAAARSRPGRPNLLRRMSQERKLGLISNFDRSFISLMSKQHAFFVTFKQKLPLFQLKSWIAGRALSGRLYAVPPLYRHSHPETHVVSVSS